MDTNVYIAETREFASLYPLMTVTQLLTFMCIARRGRCTISDVERELGLSKASASRNVAAWTNMTAFGKEGLGFVSKQVDPEDSRNRILTLTPEGKAFYERMRELTYERA